MFPTKINFNLFKKNPHHQYTTIYKRTFFLFYLKLPRKSVSEQITENEKKNVN